MTAGPQHGLLAHPPQHLLIAALAFTAPADTVGNQVNLTELREVLRLELAGDLDEINETTPKDLPTPETGEVGVADGWDQTNFTVDVGFLLPDTRPWVTPPRGHFPKISSRSPGPASVH